MKTRNRIIASLFIVGISLFLVVKLIIVPQQHAKAEQYAQEQKEPTTHDLNSILKYKNPYMGNASNTINLIHHLPLSDIGATFEQNPKELTFQVKYKKSVSSIGEEKVKHALIYNSTAVFALIDNLQVIKFRFMDTTYTAKRASVEKLYKNFDNILKEEVWKEEVQQRLRDNNYVKTAEKVLMEE